MMASTCARPHPSRWPCSGHEAKALQRPLRGEAMDLASILISAGIAIVLGGMFYGIKRLRRTATGQKQDRLYAEAQALARSEIATIVEHWDLTGWGTLWTIIFMFASVVAFIGGTLAKTVLQEIEASISLLSTLLLFGIAFGTMRKRSYTIYRSEQSSDRSFQQ